MKQEQERILWCLSTTEVFPFSKLGGLGDYSYSFAKALHRRGYEVVVFSPYYEKHMLPLVREIGLKTERRTIRFRDNELNYDCLSGSYDGIGFVFFRYPEFWGHDDMFLSDCPRYNENLDGSTLLGKALSEELRIRLGGEAAGRRVIVQGNDAPASFFAPFLRADQLPNVALTKLYCVHSLAPDAAGRIYRLDEYYLDRELRERLGPHFHRDSTWLETLAPFFDRFMTVSPNYALEITKGEAQLNDLLKRMFQEGRLRGFLNGLEHEYWSIRTSPWIDREDGQPLASIKRQYKTNLCAEIGLPEEEPLLLFVGRITPQKGLDRLNDILRLNPELRIVVLGQGEPLERYIEEPYRGRVVHFDQYEDKLCHRLLAAADYSIVPSEYEPCGYVAMHAPRFGVIPLVRRTGGLVNIAKYIERLMPNTVQFDNAAQFVSRYRAYAASRIHENDELREELSKMEWRWEDVLEPMERFVLSEDPQPIRFDFYSDEHLLEKLREETVSLARFGDGEFSILLGRGAPAFQKFDTALQERLREIIHSDHPNVMIGIPRYFNDTSKLHFFSKPYWEEYIANNLDFIHSLNGNKIYANAGITRPYIDLGDRSGSKERFERFRSIWKGRKVLVVEGRKTRFGVNNDLLGEAGQVHRILCPETNAFSVYEAIKSEVVQAAAAYDVILVALGPTATVLCYDLGLLNRRAIDIGHLDIEYDWYSNKAVWKVQIGNKYVSEARHGNPYIESAPLDRSYYDSIIGEIGG